MNCLAAIDTAHLFVGRKCSVVKNAIHTVIYVLLNVIPYLICCKMAVYIVANYQWSSIPMTRTAYPLEGTDNLVLIPRTGVSLEENVTPIFQGRI